MTKKDQYKDSAVEPAEATEARTADEFAADLTAKLDERVAQREEEEAIFLKLQRCVEKKKALRPLLDELEPLQAQLREEEAEVKAQILSYVEKYGDAGGFAVEGVKTQYRQSYTRDKVDTKGLKGYAVADPKLRAFFSTIEVAATVVVKYDPEVTA